MATQKTGRYNVGPRGLRYPKSKTLREKIQAGEAIAADVKEWVRVPAGKKGVAIPSDVARELARRGAIEEA